MTTSTVLDEMGGPWTVTAPAGVTVTPTLAPAGYAEAINISIGYTQADFNGTANGGRLLPITFTGPALDPSGPPIANITPGLELAPTTIEIKNDSGVLITSYEIGVENTGPEPTFDVSTEHPHYAHFHDVSTTPLVDASTGTPNANITLFAPGTTAAFGPAGEIPAPNVILARGTIAPGATEKLVGLADGGVTLHSEDTTPGPQGGNFTLFFDPVTVAPVFRLPPIFLRSSASELASFPLNDHGLISPIAGLAAPLMRFIGPRSFA